jgi:hypothetical protein
LNIKSLEIIFPGTGAISKLNFCSVCCPLKRVVHGADSNCLRTESGGDMNGVEEIAFDNFESYNEQIAIKGREKCSLGQILTAGVHLLSWTIRRWYESSL